MFRQVTDCQLNRSPVLFRPVAKPDLRGFFLLAATGLYYLAELVEEYTKLAKKIITYSTQAVLVLHVLVLVIDRLPVKCVAAGIAAHLCYLGQLQRYPFMQLWSPVTAGSIGKNLISLFSSFDGHACVSLSVCYGKAYAVF